jgi:hypothetical protein
MTLTNNGGDNCLHTTRSKEKGVNVVGNQVGLLIESIGPQCAEPMIFSLQIKVCIGFSLSKTQVSIPSCDKKYNDNDQWAWPVE